MSRLDPTLSARGRVERRRVVEEIDGCRVRYEVMGDGPPLVFLHGWGARIESWGTVPSAFVSTRTVVALDWPGFGESAPLARPWDNFDFARFLASFLRHVCDGPATLVGHSRGGAASIVLAAREPGLVHKLVLVDSAGIVPPRGPRYHARVGFVKASRRLLGLPPLRRWQDVGMRRVLRMIGSSDYNQATDPNLRATLVRVVNQDLRDLLPAIKASTLLIWGSADEDTPLRDAKIMERLIPDAGLVVLEGADHFSYLRQPDVFCRTVRYFLEHA